MGDRLAWRSPRRVARRPIALQKDAKLGDGWRAPKAPSCGSCRLQHDDLGSFRELGTRFLQMRWAKSLALGSTYIDLRILLIKRISARDRS